MNGKDEPRKSEEPLVWVSRPLKKGDKPSLEEIIEGARAVAKAKVDVAEADLNAARAHLNEVEARVRAIFQNWEKEQ